MTRHGVPDIVAAVAVVVSVTGAIAAAQTKEPDTDLIIGVWQLDVAASSFNPGPPPKSEVRVYEAEHEGVKATVVTTFADGRTTKFEYTTSYNDVTAAVTGSETSDAIRMRKVDPYTAEAQLSLGGRVVGRTRRVIAQDGQTMTITLNRQLPVTVNNVTVYRRR